MDRSSNTSRGLAAITTFAVVSALTFVGLGAAASTAVVAHADVSSDIEFGSNGMARVLVGVRVPVLAESMPTPANRRRMAAAQDELLSTLEGPSHRVLHRFGFIPTLLLEVSREALGGLAKNPLVAHVRPDRQGRAALAESTSIVRATTAAAAGLTGAGWIVAVIDSGVDLNHPFIAGATLPSTAACFADGWADDPDPDNHGGQCPNRETSMYGPAAAAPCRVVNGCPHGTHVAGIALGRNTAVDASTTMSGVARGASLMPINVFHPITCGPGVECGRYFDSDVIKAIEWVLLWKWDGTLNFAAVTLSVGGGGYTSKASCDSANPDLKREIGYLRSVNIAPIAASGNDSNSAGMWAPACVTGAISVGSTNDSDVVDPSSNSTDFLDLLAPGMSIRSSVPGGAYDTWDGTSMAVPHVAGAWAVLKQAHPDATVAQVLRALGDSGKYVTDSRNNVTRARIDVYSAYEWLGLRVLDTTAWEHAGYAYLSVRLPYAFAQTQSVDWWTWNGTATSPSDYVAQYGRVDFTPGETTKTIAVRLTDDSTTEGSERFGVSIRLVDGTVRTTKGYATATIRDNDGRYGRTSPSPGYYGTK